MGDTRVPPPPAVTRDAGDAQHATAARIDGQSHIYVVRIESEQNVDASTLDRSADWLESRPPHLGFDFRGREHAERRRDARNGPGRVTRRAARLRKRQHWRHSNEDDKCRPQSPLYPSHLAPFGAPIKLTYLQAVIVLPGLDRGLDRTIQQPADADMDCPVKPDRKSVV